jgi:hypothetical protein
MAVSFFDFSISAALWSGSIACAQAGDIIAKDIHSDTATLDKALLLPYRSQNFEQVDRI